MVIKNISLSGGSVKGVAYVGVIKFLEENLILDKIEQFSGTSIGSLFCILMVLGYSSKELEKICLNIDISLLEDININLLFTDYGIDSSIKIQKTLKFFINRKGFEPDITFIDLFNKTGKSLHVATCRLSDYSLYIFNKDNTPNFPVYKACIYSMNIPLLYVAHLEENQYYIDGCFVRNLPIEIFDVENTVGFHFLNKKNIDSVVNIKNLQGYIMKVMNCSMHKGNYLEIENYTIKGYKLIEIDVHNISALNFEISIDERKKLIDSGYHACNDAPIFKKK